MQKIGINQNPYIYEIKGGKRNECNSKTHGKSKS